MSNKRTGSTPLYEAKYGSEHCRVNKLCVECGGALSGRQRRWCGSACVTAYRIRAEPSTAREHVERRDHGVCTHCGLDTEKEIRSQIKEADKEAFEAYMVYLNRLRPEGHWVGSRVRLEGYKPGYGPWTHTGYAPGGSWAPESSSRSTRRRRRRPRHVEWNKGPLWELVRTKRLEKLDEIGHGEFKRWWWRKTYWDMDHIRPVVEGGGGCGLENLRTLCVVCHSKRTAREARVRARGGMRRIERRPNEECEFESPCRRPNLCSGCVKYRARARTTLASTKGKKG